MSTQPTKEEMICARCGEEIMPGFECGTEERPLCEECYYDMTDICPVCAHPKAYFQIEPQNY